MVVASRTSLGLQAKATTDLWKQLSEERVPSRAKPHLYSEDAATAEVAEIRAATAAAAIPAATRCKTPNPTLSLIAVARLLTACRVACTCGALCVCGVARDPREMRRLLKATPLMLMERRSHASLRGRPVECSLHAELYLLWTGCGATIASSCGHTPPIKVGRD